MASFSLIVLFACLLIFFLCRLTLPAGLFSFLFWPLLLWINLESFLANLYSYEDSPLRIFVLIANATLIIISYFQTSLALASAIVGIFPGGNAVTAFHVCAIVLLLVLVMIVLWLRERAREEKLLIQKIAFFDGTITITEKEKPVDELKKWKQLYDEGTITEEMFSRKREELLKKK